MAVRTKPRVIGVSGTLIAILWNAYSNFTTVEQLPSDAGRLARMLTDPPVWLPWLATAGFIIFTAWAFFWPKPPKDDKDGRRDGGYNQTHFGSGDNNMDF